MYQSRFPEGNTLQARSHKFWLMFQFFRDNLICTKIQQALYIADMPRADKYIQTGGDFPREVYNPRDYVLFRYDYHKNTSPPDSGIFQALCIIASPKKIVLWPSTAFSLWTTSEAGKHPDNEENDNAGNIEFLSCKKKNEQEQPQTNNCQVQNYSSEFVSHLLDIRKMVW